MIWNLKDTSGNYDSAFLGNWAEIYMVDALLRNPGIGQVTNFGLLQYSIRVWLQPKKLASLGITTTDVVNAINAQNTDYAIGQIGTEPCHARWLSSTSSLPWSTSRSWCVQRNHREGGSRWLDSEVE